MAGGGQTAPPQAHGMTSLPEPIAALTAALKRLPGIGPRSAERLALHLVQSDAESVRQLARTLVEARERIHSCTKCGALTEKQPCPLCESPGRDGSLICLVERAVDIISIEKSGAFRGRFHVLGGRLSPLDGIGPEDLRIGQLEARLDKEPIKELILALSTDVEGDATCHYLAKRLGNRGIKISRLAHGLPAGSGLEFADELTLSHALEGRRDIGG
jgi:recombination protein RecR